MIILIEITTTLNPKEAIFTTIKNSSILNHTLLFGPYDISSLSVSKDAIIDNNRVIRINKPKINISTELFPYKILKKAYEESFFVIIEIPSHEFYSGLLKILSINIDTGSNTSYSIRLEEYN